MFTYTFRALGPALLSLTLSAQVIPGRTASIAVSRSMRAPLPDAFEVQRIAASPSGIWYQGVNHSGELPEVAVYQWSPAGVRQMSIPPASTSEPLVITDLSTDLSGNGYLVANGRLYEAEGSSFQAREDFAKFVVRAIPGNWLITASNEVFHLPVLNGRAATKGADKLGEIDAWSLAPDGALWIAARGGEGTRLYRLESHGSAMYEVQIPGAEETLVNALYADSAGAAWVALADGRVARHQAGATDFISTGNITQIVENSRGSYYLLPAAFDQQDTSVIAIPSSEHSSAVPETILITLPGFKGAVRTAAVDHLGGVWLSIGRYGAFRLKSIADLNWPRGPVVDQLDPVAPRLAAKQSSELARRSADASSGIAPLPGAKFTVLNTSHGIIGNNVSCIVSDTTGSVYLTTGYENQGDDPASAGSGITRFDHRQVTNYTTTNGLASNTVQACALDSARNTVWFGTTNGLARFNPATSTFTTFLSGQRVQDVILHGNNVWVATFTNGVYRLDAATGNQLNQYTAGNNKVISIVVDNAGTVWAGTHGSGLYTLGASFTLVTSPSVPSGIIQDLEVDASDNLWISVWNAGIYRRTPGGSATQFTSANGLGGVFAGLYRTYRIERDAANNLWFSHGSFGQMAAPNAAVTFLPAGQVNAASPAFERYTTANGFPTNLVLALYSEDASTMWFGSPGGGAWRLGGPVDAPGWPQPLTGSVFFNSPLLVDLDGNRNLEVVVGDNAGKIYAFRPNGTTLWTYDTRNAFPGQTTGSMSVQSSVAAGDVDGDGEIDLVVGLGGQVINGTVGQGGVLILSRTGTFKRIIHTLDITDAGRTVIRPDGFREGVFATPVLANVDADPELEIMAGSFDNHLYAWNGDGTLVHNTNWPFNARDTTVTSAAVFDLHGAGQKSIIFGHDYSGDEIFDRGGVLRVFNSRGEDVAGFPKGNLEQVIWSSPVVVDLDNDGVYEIIHGSGLDLSTVGNAPTDALVGQLVYAWRRDGASYKPGTNGRLATTEGRSWASFAVGDMDNDGSPELVIATTSLRNKSDQLINQSGAVVADANAFGQKVYVFDAAGNLKPGFPVRPYTAIGGANLIGSPVLADTNGDGFLDIIIAVGPGLIVLDRNGRGVPGMGIFENLQDMGYPGEVNGTPAVGDIDLDGNLELVWTQGTGNGSTAIVRVVKLGPVNSTVHRSWPMWRRGANRNGIFGPLVGLTQLTQTGNTAQFYVQAFAGRNTISSVTMNLAPIGGSTSFALTDNGSGGDPVANDGWFSGSFNAGAVAAGTYTLSVTVLDSAGRSDTQTFAFTRVTSTPGCTFTVSPAGNNSVAYTGVKATFAVTASPSSCAWTASSNRSWAQVYPLSGTGSGTIEYTIFPNFSTSTRTATFNISGKTFNVTQAAGVGTPNQRFVAQIYFNILGRLASQSEINLQANPLGAGTPRQDLVWSFFNSTEFNLGGRFVAGLYVGLLDRNAEYGGWLFQRNALSTGVVNPNQLVSNFITGQEFTLKFGNPSNDDYVRLLYRNVLLREPAPAEVQLQSNALASGVSRVQLATNFLNSNEFRVGTGPRLTAFLLYALLLQRDPTTSERAAREAQIAGGADIKALIAELLNSGEFSTLLQ